MRCTICDRCNRIVEDERKLKVVTYARPLNVGASVRCPAPGDNRQMNDHIWTKELCPDCAIEFEEFMDTEPSGSGGNKDPGGDAPGGNTDQPAGDHPGEGEESGDEGESKEETE